MLVFGQAGTFGGEQLGDIRSDVVTVLSLIPGISHAQADSYVTQATDYIEGRAKAGAEQAIPPSRKRRSALAKLASNSFGPALSGQATPVRAKRLRATATRRS